MARKTKEETEKTYHALLEAAAELFRIQGYSRTTLNEIAKKAGMTRGAFYWHFEKKSDVIRAIWENHAYASFNPIREAIAKLPLENPAGAYRNHVREMIDVISDNQSVARAMFIILHNMEVSEKNNDLIEFLGEQHIRFHGSMSEAFIRIHAAGQLKPGISAEQAASGCSCLLLGMINRALLPFGDFNLKWDGQEIFKSHLDGILRE
ncbi:TetR family transcriptional regulator [Cohaesibacter celericrescens]|uniref:TetR family transcriptional regulator n=1 Tax=Cohaesibacter celericrescens TaxID=2067669 RepID=UPI0015E0EF31|nr:TetR family transcriptional regulator [Cohaesibacter celericrescens]